MKWFDGLIAKIEVVGNVVSRQTGVMGNRTTRETFISTPDHQAGSDGHRSAARDDLSAPGSMAPVIF